MPGGRVITLELILLFKWLLTLEKQLNFPLLGLGPQNNWAFEFLGMQARDEGEMGTEDQSQQTSFPDCSPVLLKPAASDNTLSEC